MKPPPSGIPLTFHQGELHRLPVMYVEATDGKTYVAPLGTPVPAERPAPLSPVWVDLAYATKVLTGVQSMRDLRANVAREEMRHLAQGETEA